MKYYFSAPFNITHFYAIYKVRTADLLHLRKHRTSLKDIKQNEYPKIYVYIYTRKDVRLGK